MEKMVNIVKEKGLDFPHKLLMLFIGNITKWHYKPFEIMTVIVKVELATGQKSDNPGSIIISLSYLHNKVGVKSKSEWIAISE